MVQSPSWEANWFAASQEIPCISWNPTLHYRTHKHPPPISILGQPNPVHTPTSHPVEIHPNIIHPSMSRSPQCSPSLRFPHQNPIPPLLSSHTHATVLSPEESSRKWVFLNINFYREGLLAPRPTPKLEDHASLAVRDCLFNLFAAILLIGGHSSIRNLKTRHAVVTGTHYHRYELTDNQKCYF